MGRLWLTGWKNMRWMICRLLLEGSSHRVREKDVGAPPRCADPSNPGAFQQARGRMESHRRLLLHAAPNVALEAQPIPALRSLPAGYRAGTKGARPRPRSHWLRRHRLAKTALSSSGCAGVTAGLDAKAPATRASQTTPAAPPPCPNLLLSPAPRPTQSPPTLALLALTRLDPWPHRCLASFPSRAGAEEALPKPREQSRVEATGGGGRT